MTDEQIVRLLNDILVSLSQGDEIGIQVWERKAQAIVDRLSNLQPPVFLLDGMSKVRFVAVDGWNNEVWVRDTDKREWVGQPYDSFELAAIAAIDMNKPLVPKVVQQENGGSSE